MSHLSKKKSLSSYSFFILGLAILFFLYEFFLRVLPATIAQNIINSLDMTIEQFAFIGSAYYLTYSIMQIPVGLLLDRFSAKKLVTGACALCALGIFWFSFAQTFLPAFFSRLLIGIGSSFGFVALVIVTLNWFPRKHFASLMGCSQFLGAIGPLAAGVPIALLLETVDGNWRLIFLWVGLIGFMLTGLLGLFFQGKPVVTNKIVFVDRIDSLGKRIKKLLMLSQVWCTFVYAGMVYVALPTLGAFWGISYLETRGLNKPVAALLISMIWVGLAIGSPLFGRISDMMKRRKPIIALCAAIGFLSSLVFIITPLNNVYYLGFLLFLIGLGSSGQNLSFAVMAEHAPESLQATAIGLNNTAIMGFAALIPPLVTMIIHHYIQDGLITVFAFSKGLIIIPICFSIAFLISAFGLRETFCRQQGTICKVQRSQS